MRPPPASDALDTYLRLLDAPGRAAVAALLAHPTWAPRPENRAQIAGIICPARVLLFGGMAGGGKTDLLLGAAITQHRRSLITRREATQARGIITRGKELLGTRSYHGVDHCFRWEDGGPREMQIGSIPHHDDWERYQGTPFDLQAYDEAAHHDINPVGRLMAWNRSTDPRQRCRVILASNPPIGAQGVWLSEMFAPWVDQGHPNPAGPGELRWYVGDTEYPGPDAELVRGERIVPDSRTYIPARVDDNPDLVSTGYIETLEALPDALRAPLRHGHFGAAVADNPSQVIPTADIMAAMSRWEDGPPPGPMTAVGVDVARSSVPGGDRFVISRRHGNWYAPLLTYPGTAAPDGGAAAALVVSALRDGAPVMIDVCGPGGSPYDHLMSAGVDVHPFNAGASSTCTSRYGGLRFVNKGAEAWWTLREALDPMSGENIALPPSRWLLAELACRRWSMGARGIALEPKDEAAKRIGRSPDEADAVVMAYPTLPKRATMRYAPVVVHCSHDLLM